MGMKCLHLSEMRVYGRDGQLALLVKLVDAEWTSPFGRLHRSRERLTVGILRAWRGLPPRPRPQGRILRAIACVAKHKWASMDLPRFRRHLSASGRRPGKVRFGCPELGRRIPRSFAARRFV